MLEGITVLSQTTALPAGYPLPIVFLVMIGCGMIATIFYIIKYSTSPIATKVIICIFCIIILAGCVFGLYAIHSLEETRYKVIIDDHVLFTDFNERYEIISQDGLILTIVERAQK